MRAQSAVEFLTTYSWAFFVIGIFVVGTLALIFIPSKGTPTYAPESCYIQPSLPCFQAVVLTNSTSSKFLMVMQNNLGVKMYFPPNSLTLTPNYNGGTSYLGSCLPQNAIAGSTVICNATLGGYASSAGSQLNPRFAINYQLCTPACSNTIYNTTGTAIVIATPYKSVIFKVSLSSDTTGGQVALGGARYASAANVVFISGLNYQLYAVPPNSAYAFNGWIASSNMTLTGGLQSTTVTATGPGSIKATFASSSTSTSTTSTSTTTILPVFVQSANTLTLYTSSSGVITMPSVVSAGDIIFVSVSNVGGSGSVSSMTDSLGNSYSKIVARTDYSRFELWYSKLSFGGSDAITVTESSVSYGFDSIATEFSGVSSTSLLLSGIAGSAGGGGLSVPSFTPSAGNLVFVAGSTVGSINPLTLSSGGGYTAGKDDTGYLYSTLYYANAVQYATVWGGGGTTAPFTVGGTNNDGWEEGYATFG